jgi:hypothetical protein
MSRSVFPFNLRIADSSSCEDLSVMRGAERSVIREFGDV